MTSENDKTINILSIIAAVATFAAVAIIVVFPIYDPDVFWHLANGRAMVETGRIIQEEIFSYTAFGKHFNNHQWLGQVILFLAYGAGGATGLLLFKVAMTLVINVVQFITARRMGATLVEASLLCLLMMHLTLSRYVERPQLFSFLGLAVLGLILYAYRKGTASSRILVALPVMFVVWDCIHGAAYGLLFFLVFMGAETGKHLLRNRLPQWEGLRPMAPERLRNLWIWSGITLLCMVASPFGLRQYDVFVNLVNERTETQFIEEFMSLPLALKYARYWIVIGVSGVLVMWRGRRSDATFVLLYLAFAVLFIRYIRSVEAFAVVILPILAHEIALLREAATARGWRFFPGTVAAALVLLLGYTAMAKYPHDQSRSLPRKGIAMNWRTGVNENVFPVGSVEFIRQHGLTGNMFNSDLYGGYLAYFLAPERKIFQYNHPTIFTHHFRFLRDPAFRSTFDISYAIVHDEEDKAVFKDYVTVYREPFAELRLKDISANRRLIERYAIRQFDPTKDSRTIASQAGNPQVFPILTREMADYLSCRTDPRIADLLALFLEQTPPTAVENKEGLIRQALTRNGNNEKLHGALKHVLDQEKHHTNIPSGGSR